MPPLQSTVAVYPIGVVQRLTGLSARQIRYYEKEGLLRPSRTRGNRRLYSPADVERLRQVKALLEQGLNLEGVRAYLAAQERETASVPGPGSVSTSRPQPAPGPEPAPSLPAAARTAEVEGTAGPGGGSQIHAGAADAESAPESSRAAFALGAEEGRADHHPAIFRQARGRRLSSLFPVDQQAELVRLLESRRAEAPPVQ